MQNASDSDAIQISSKANYVHMEPVSLRTDPDFLNRIMPAENVVVAESFLIQHYRGYPGYLNGFVLNGAVLGGHPQIATLVS